MSEKIIAGNQLTFTEKGNQLIAEFIGYEYDRTLPGHGGSVIMTLGINDCRYHSSWDWLMPVVERIESLGYEVTIRGEIVNIYIPNCEDFGATQKTKIGSTWLAVVEFIKWYNKNILKHEEN